MIHYEVQINDAAAHYIEIRLTIDAPDPGGQVLRLPNWIPGSYMIRDFSRNIVGITATCNDTKVQLLKLDKSTWQAPSELSSLVVSYRVYAWELSVRAAHVDQSHVFFNGTSVFLEVVGQSHNEHRLSLVRPKHDIDSNFKVATSLSRLSVNEDGYGDYSAPDYDDLIDHPIEQGQFKRLTFLACGVPHEIVFTGRCDFDEQRLVDDLTQICEYQIRFFGEPAPVDRYVFLVMVVQNGYGGLEHRASTALMISSEHLPIPGLQKANEKYVEFLGLCSHEYFHTWNVKRLKPAKFIPFQLNEESYTELLWFFEGMTSYYDDLTLVRTSLIDQRTYLNLLSKTLTRVKRGSGRLLQTVTESSFDAWHKFYKQDENAPNAIVSYYAKGALVALCVDAILRSESESKISLDTIMRELWKHWLATGKGLDEKTPQSLISSMATGDISSFLHSALYTTEDLPLKSLLRHLGINLQWCQRKNNSDVGGWVDEVSQLPNGIGSDDASSKVSPTISDEKPWLGANSVGAEGGIKLTHVMTGGPAGAAGLSAGDVIVAINYQAITQTGLDERLRRCKHLAQVVIHYFRLGELKETQLVIKPAPLDTAVLHIEDESLLQSWLADPEQA